MMHRVRRIGAGILAGTVLTWGIGMAAVATQGSFSGSGATISGRITIPRPVSPASGTVFSKYDGSHDAPKSRNSSRKKAKGSSHHAKSEDHEFLGWSNFPGDANGFSAGAASDVEDVKLQINPPIMRLNPSQDAIVNMETFAYLLDAGPQTLTAQAAGQSVSIRVTPTLFEWNWGDGSVTRSKNPGAPWPNGTVRHSYTQPGRYPVTCRTYWKGDWEVAGEAGEDAGDVKGDLFTDSSAGTLDVRLLVPYLVDARR